MDERSIARSVRFGRVGVPPTYAKMLPPLLTSTPWDPSQGEEFADKNISYYQARILRREIGITYIGILSSANSSKRNKYYLHWNFIKREFSEER